MAETRVTQVVRETALTETPNARVTQVAVEILTSFADQPTVSADFGPDELAISDGMQIEVDRAVVADFFDSLAISDSLAVALTGHRQIDFAETMALADLLEVAPFPNLNIDFSDAAAVTDALSILTQKFAAEPGGIDLVIARFFLDVATQYYSQHYVRHPDWSYEGRAIQYGQIGKSIPNPAGLGRISDGTVTLGDTDNAIRNLLDQSVPFRRLLELKIGPEGGRESLFGVVHIGEVARATAGNGTTSVVIRDVTWNWIQATLPVLGVAENFPNMHESVDEFFIPLIFGDVNTSIPLSAQGAIEVKLLDTLTNGYPVARHPVEAVTVYRKLPTEEVFTVLGSGFSIVEIPQLIDGITYTITWMQLSSPAVDGTEFRVDVQGMDERAQWAGFAPIAGGGGALRNPVDALVNLILIEQLDTRTERFDAGAFATVRDLCTTLGYFCDGAITEPLTPAEIIGRLSTSFGMDFFMNRFGQMALSLTTEPPPSPPVLDQILDIQGGTIVQDWPLPNYNRIRYSYARNHATGEFALKGVFDNENDQITLATPEEKALDPDARHIVPEDVELHFVRDAAVADAVMAERSTYVDLASYQITLTVPLPQQYLNIELANYVRVNYHAGIPVGGWANEAFKLLAMQINLQQKALRITAVRRVGPPGEIVASELGPSVPQNNSRFTPYPGPLNGQFFSVFTVPTDAAQLEVHFTPDWGVTWQTFPASVKTTNNIGSFDRSDNGLLFHIATQEQSTNRVAYWRFNVGTFQWEAENVEIVASTTHLSEPGVSIAHKSPSNHLVEIAYQGDFKTVIGDSRTPNTNKSREYNTISGAISSERDWGNSDIDTENHNVGRLHAVDADNVHQFWRSSNSFPPTGWPYLFNRTLRSGGTFAGDALRVSRIPHSQRFACADPVRVNGRIIVITQSTFGDPRAYVFVDEAPLKTSIGIAKVSEDPVITSDRGIYETNASQATMNVIDGNVHLMVSRWSGTVDRYAFYKVSTDDGLSWPFESPREDFIATPRVPAPDFPNMMNATVFKHSGKIWIASFNSLTNNTEQRFLLIQVERDFPLTMTWTDFLALI